MPRPRGTTTPDWGIEPQAPAQDQARRTGSQLHPLPRDGEPEAGAAPSRPADTFSVPPYLLERHSRANLSFSQKVSPLVAAGLYTQPCLATSAAIGWANERPTYAPTEAEQAEPRGDPVSREPTQPP